MRRDDPFAARFTPSRAAPLLRLVRLTHGTAVTRPAAAPAAFTPAANDQPLGSGLHAAMQRAIARHGLDAGGALVTAAQRAFWAGDVQGCRWWRSVGRMVDRRLAAHMPRRVTAVRPTSNAALTIR